MATKLDLADAQFIGFSYGKDGRILDMVMAMGLNKKEWIRWRQDYTSSYLTDSEMKEIDDHFNRAAGAFNTKNCSLN